MDKNDDDVLGSIFKFICFVIIIFIMSVYFDVGIGELFNNINI